MIILDDEDILSYSFISEARSNLDPSDNLGLYFNWEKSTSEYIRNLQSSAPPIPFNFSELSSIVMCGLGGSAQGARFAADFYGDNITIPYVIHREVSLPAFVNQSTLCIVISYSGNTREALSMLLSARKQQAKIVIIASGGILLDYAKEHSIPHIVIPGGMSPRICLPIICAAVCYIFQEIGIGNALSLFQSSLAVLNRTFKMCAPEVPISKNIAKQIASLTLSAYPIFLGCAPYTFPAYRARLQFAENVKLFAWSDFLPEYNHNAICFWSDNSPPFPNNHPYFTVIICGSRVDEEMRARIDFTQNAISKTQKVIILESKEKTLIEELLSLTSILDISSVYAAYLHGVDPNDISLMDSLKHHMHKKFGRGI